MDTAGAMTRDEVRQLDRQALEQWGVPGIVLMENAGRNAADAIAAHLGGCEARRIAVVAGTGNNGGDGFVIARHLSIRGAQVEVFLIGQAQKLSPDAAVNFEIISKLGLAISVLDSQAVAGLGRFLRDFDLLVDAIGGTGIQGPLRGLTAAAVEQVNASGVDVVAVDIPTGLDCDSGQAPGPTIRAKLTVTMAANKVGFTQPGAAEYTGKVVVVDIGVPVP